MMVLASAINILHDNEIFQNNDASYIRYARY